MNIFRICSKNSGFTLIETVLGVALAGGLVAGLLLLWEFGAARERGLEAYWAAKQEVETAYEITHRALRQSARKNLEISPGRISFTGVDNVPWVFFREGASYEMAHNNVVTTLIADGCVTVSFTLSGSQVTIHLAVEMPSEWQGEGADLSIAGRVYLRNLQ